MESTQNWFPRVGTCGYFTRRGSKKGWAKGTTQDYLTICSEVVPDIHTLSPVIASTRADKDCIFFLSSSTINLLLNLKGKGIIDSSTEDVKQKRKNSLQLRLQSCFSIISSLVAWVFLFVVLLGLGKWASELSAVLVFWTCTPSVILISFFLFFFLWYFSFLSWDPTAYQAYYNFIIGVYCGCTCILLHTFLYN